MKISINAEIVVKFEYSIPEGVCISDEGPLCVSREPVRREVVKIEGLNQGGAMILANKEGWEYLAKVCLEMAYASQQDPLFHVHRADDLSFSEEEAKDKLVLAQISDDLEGQILSKRKI